MCFLEKHGSKGKAVSYVESMYVYAVPLKSPKIRSLKYTIVQFKGE